ncbi:carbon-nitrogen hydrolase family protein [Arthrobacter sp. PAMC25284]|uniref:carbon-nitrogen hydrolase family protein n=1 Tax=Arthrobacter sp. PAMC25284 TaxID=2861279 RepID=UPI001C62E04C|nr:carbon-nitrogen hydrolase family protein [Arthrobacter sp. PAMC25284]QYF90334.1 carbon-nitrogen hydrolase family protein [Arthrobacter sp. PAMC25284]
MQRILPLIAVQAPPRLIGEPVKAFAAEVSSAVETHPDSKLVVFPELHLFGDSFPDLARTEALQAAAEPLDGPRVNQLRELAADLGIWLVPGSVCERGPEGQLFNTQLVLSPRGELAAYYRKVFPWRPSEPYDPGDRFTTVDLDGIGRVGLNICYDAWFPEVSRQLAWMGAEVILNVVKTTTPDRRQELVLARANAIVNQLFVVSVNCAGPTGQGRSLIVDPEGNTIAEAHDDAPALLAAELDLAAVEHVRARGTEGSVRPWSQFHSGETAIELPIYQGRIDPDTWAPTSTNR